MTRYTVALHASISGRLKTLLSSGLGCGYIHLELHLGHNTNVNAAVDLYKPWLQCTWQYEI